jgi:hypothetical protein
MKSVFKVLQQCYHMEYEEQALAGQAIKQWLEEFMETDTVLHKKGAGRPSVMLTIQQGS